VRTALRAFAPAVAAEENRDRLLFRVTKLLHESQDGAKKVVCTGFSGPRSQPNTREPEFSHKLFSRGLSLHEDGNLMTGTLY
jgi:hypothetical protein